MNSTAKESSDSPQRRLDSPLQRVVDDMMKMNEYDYNKMLSELELMELRDRNKKDKVKVYRELSKKWNQRLHNMRESKERFVDDKRQEILDQIKRKNESCLKILDKAQSDRENRLIKMNKTLQTERSIKSKMDEHFKKLEHERLEIEKLIENRISLFSENNQEHLNSVKEKFSQRINQSLENFYTNLQAVKERMDQKVKEDEQKTIDKFEKWYFYLKSQKEKQKEKNLKIQQKRHKNNENFFELEADNERRRSEFKRKLDEFEIRKREVSEKQMMKIREIMNKEKENYKKTLEKKKTFEAEKTNYYNNILRYQSSVITRSDLKESSSELSRLSAYEKVILRQMQLERKLNLFHSEMNKLKDSSVLKKSKQQKRGIFLELKRQEEERQRKEKENKEKAAGN